MKRTTNTIPLSEAYKLNPDLRRIMNEAKKGMNFFRKKLTYQDFKERLKNLTKEIKISEEDIHAPEDELICDLGCVLEALYEAKYDPILP